MSAGTPRVPAVSIGMPVYNAEPFLRGALDALRRQTFTDFELIISDNASTDATAAICQEYLRKDARLRYVLQPENMGYVKNFDYVLQAARAERFMWAACDDLWEPDFLERLNAALDRSPDASLAFCYLAVLPSGDRPGWTLRSIGGLQRRGWLARVVTYLLQPGRAGKPNLIYGLMRRRFTLRADALSRYPPFGHDMLFGFQMLMQGHFVIEPAVLFYKRMPTRRYWQLGEGYWWLCTELVRCSFRYADGAKRFGCARLTQGFVLALALTRSGLDIAGEFVVGVRSVLRRVLGRKSRNGAPTSVDVGS